MLGLDSNVANVKVRQQFCHGTDHNLGSSQCENAHSTSFLMKHNEYS